MSRFLCWWKIIVPNAASKGPRGIKSNLQETTSIKTIIQNNRKGKRKPTILLENELEHKENNQEKCQKTNKNEKLYDKTLDLLLCWVHIKKAHECKPWGPTDKHSRRLDDGRGNRLWFTDFHFIRHLHARIESHPIPKYFQENNERGLGTIPYFGD